MSKVYCMLCGKEMKQEKYEDNKIRVYPCGCQDEAKPINLVQAVNLTVNNTLHHRYFKNADGTPQRWRVNGKVKTWKTKPWKIQVPLKHGLYDHGYLTEDNLDNFTLAE